MSTRVETEDIASTKSEKFLAVVLAAFVLIGSGWLYWKAYDWVGPETGWNYSVVEQEVLDRADIAAQDYYSIEEHHAGNTDQLNQARADLNLAVDRGDETADLEENYREAQTEAAASRELLATAKTEMEQAEAKAQEVRDRHDRLANDAETSWQHWLVAGLRFLFIAGMLIGSLFWTQRLRERESRYVPIGFAITATATILAFTFIIDYITDYIDILELGPIVLSLLGVAATIGAFALLQRYLAKRVGRTRVRKGECPFCAFPVRQGQAHCEGCGRGVEAECASCQQSRRVGSPFCAHCGQA